MQDHRVYASVGRKKPVPTEAQAKNAIELAAGFAPVAGEAADAYEVVTGQTWTGQDGSRIGALAALAVPFAGSRAFKEVIGGISSAVKYFARANGTFDEAVDAIISGSKKGRKTKGRTTQYRRDGGNEQLREDFNYLIHSEGVDVSVKEGGVTVGELDDGRKVVMREGSKDDSRSVLVIQDRKNKTKFRYDR